MRFNPEGDCIASGSHDKSIFLWRTYGDCDNYLVLKGGWPGGGVVLKGGWGGQRGPALKNGQRWQLLLCCRPPQHCTTLAPIKYTPC